MAEIPGLKIIDKLDADINKAVASFETAAVKAGPEIMDGLIDLTSKLKTARGGVVRSVENLKIINEIRRELNGLIDSSSYNPGLQKYFQDFKESTKTIDSYFSEIITGYASKPLYKALTREVINITANNLIGAGIEGYYHNAITEILKTNVTAGGTMRQLQAQLKNYVLENENYGSYKTLNKYASQVAEDSLRQYSRTYIETVSADLNLNHFFYKGTILSKAEKSAGTRKFCKTKAGKYFTREEVEQWGRDAATAEAAGKRGWDGVYPGTNPQTIFTFCGGYRCRHTPVPITQDLYEKRVGLK